MKFIHSISCVALFLFFIFWSHSQVSFPGLIPSPGNVAYSSSCITLVVQVTGRCQPHSLALPTHILQTTESRVGPGNKAIEVVVCQENDKEILPGQLKLKIWQQGPNELNNETYHFFPNSCLPHYKLELCWTVTRFLLCPLHLPPSFSFSCGPHPPWQYCCSENLFLSSCTLLLTNQSCI